MYNISRWKKTYLNSWRIGMDKKSASEERWKKIKDAVIDSLLWLPKLPFRIAGKLIGNWLRKHWKSVILVVVFVVGLTMMVGASFRLEGAPLVTVLVVAGIFMA